VHYNIATLAAIIAMGISIYLHLYVIMQVIAPVPILTAPFFYA
jgi:hypothetical protein